MRYSVIELGTDPHPLYEHIEALSVDQSRAQYLNDDFVVSAQMYLGSARQKDPRPRRILVCEDPDGMELVDLAHADPSAPHDWRGGRAVAKIVLNLPESNNTHVNNGDMRYAARKLAET